MKDISNFAPCRFVELTTGKRKWGLKALKGFEWLPCLPSSTFETIEGAEAAAEVLKKDHTRLAVCPWCNLEARIPVESSRPEHELCEHCDSPIYAGPTQ